MRKILLLSIFLLVLSAFSMALNTNTGGLSNMHGNPGTTVTGTFTVIDNVTGNDVTGITFSSANLVGMTDNTKTIPSSSISFNPASISTLADGATSTSITISVAIPANKQAQSYQGLVTVSGTEGGSAVTTQFTLTVIVDTYNSIDVLTYDNSVPLQVSSEEGNIKTTSFNIKNTGNTVLTINANSFDETQLDLTDSDNDVIDLSFSPSTGSFPLTINSGETKTINMQVNFVDNIDVDNYGGTLTVISGSVSDSFKLELNVQPEVCSDGIVKDGDPSSRAQAWLEIDIKEPDNGEDFKPGETMNIEVKVKNNNDDDMDVVVEAFLYNVDQAEELETVESDSIEIKDGKSETFEIELEIPTSDMDEDDTYMLYVKASEDGNEEENCNEDSVSIDIKKEKHDTVIDTFTVSPITAQCGDTVRFNVDVENVGSKDETDVFVELKDVDLGLDLKSTEFDVDSDDTYKTSFSFIIPDETSAGSYEIEAIVTFDDGDETSSKFTTLTVQCNGGTVPTISSVDLNVNQADVTRTGNAFSLPVQVKNNEDSKRAFTIEVMNADWAEPVSPQIITLNAGQTSTIFLYLQIKEDIEGRQSATVNVKEGNNVIASKTLNFDIEKEGFDFGSLMENKTLFWVAGYLVVIIVLIYFVKLLFMPKR